MMTSQVLRALEGRALVERHPHPQDGRARSLRQPKSAAGQHQAAGTDGLCAGPAPLGRCDTTATRLLCFSGAGFTSELRSLAEHDPGIQLVGPDSLYAEI